MNDGDDSMPEQAMDSPEVAEAAPLGPVRTGVAAAGAMETTRRQRGQGRRVTLARNGGGGYSIWMMSRHVQSFCNEWEDVTNFQLPEGIEQQVRLHVEVAGEARPIRPEYSGEQPEMVDAEDHRHENRLARAVDHHEARMVNNSPSPQNVPRHRLVEMFTELPQHQQEFIAGQIEANHRDTHGVALQSIAHPHPNEFQSLLGDLRESVRHTLEILDRLR